MRDFIGEWRLHCGTNSVRLFGSSRPRSAETLHCIKTSFCGNAILSPEVFSGLAFKRITNYGKSASSPKYASSFHSAAKWWHRASVRNAVVLCHTILVSRYIYRNFFKKSIRLFARATALLCHWIWCSRGRWVEEMCFPVRWAGVSGWVSLHSGAMCNA